MLEIVNLYEDYLTAMNDCVYNIIGQMFCVFVKISMISLSF